MTCLLGSSVLPSSFSYPLPRPTHEGGVSISEVCIQLGEVVREAFKRSGLSVEEWNALDQEVREQALQEVVDLWGLVPT